MVLRRKRGHGRQQLPAGILCVQERFFLRPPPALRIPFELLARLPQPKGHVDALRVRRTSRVAGGVKLLLLLLVRRGGSGRASPMGDLVLGR